ncbi:MAG: hypothetical protein K9J21_07170 [Bacteroidales bacterium]|nr:hypothetical protein [Bacteroidales bacterium]
MTFRNEFDHRPQKEKKHIRTALRYLCGWRYEEFYKKKNGTIPLSKAEEVVVKQYFDKLNSKTK